MNIPLAWIFPVLAAQRLFELWLSRRHFRRLSDRGGREFAPATFPWFVALHAGFLASLAVEGHPWRVPANGLTWACLGALAVLMAMRYWCIGSLGVHWNTRIVVLPGAERIRRGPYRWLPHPNYLVVALEFLVLPLLFRAPVTLVVFFPLNLLLLRQRIRLEERALAGTGFGGPGIERGTPSGDLNVER
jgi:methyltransferase